MDAPRPEEPGDGVSREGSLRRETERGTFWNACYDSLIVLRVHLFFPRLRGSIHVIPSGYDPRFLSLLT